MKKKIKGKKKQINFRKHGKCNFKRGLTVTFKLKNSQNYWKKWLKTSQAQLFVSKKPNYLKILLNTSEITKFEKVLNSRKFSYCKS